MHNPFRSRRNRPASFGTVDPIPDGSWSTNTVRLPRRRPNTDPVARWSLADNTDLDTGDLDVIADFLRRERAAENAQVVDRNWHPTL